MISPFDVARMDECVVRDERGLALAVLHEVDGVLVVKKTTACSIGMYLSIISRLREFGYEAR